MKMTFADSDFLSLFASCMLTRGACRCAIHDVDRNQSYHIPPVLYDLLEPENGFLVREAMKDCNSPAILESYIAFLLDHQMAFIVPESQKMLFPRMSLDYYSPFTITNVVIDVADDLSVLDHFIEDSSLGYIPVVQIRFYKSVPFDRLTSYMELLQRKELESLQLFIAQESVTDESEYRKLDQYDKLDLLFVYHASSRVHVNGLRYNTVFLKKDLDSHLHCGLISYEQFSVNTQTFSESQRHNTCLNRKVSVDIHGNIKNCPSMRQDFGNIKEVTLAEAIARPGFKTCWAITKDEISVCRDCEFRHVCTDCRAYLEDPDDLYSKPLKCGYDPYTGEWKDWSTHPMKQRAIGYYELRSSIKQVK